MIRPRRLRPAVTALLTILVLLVVAAAVVPVFPGVVVCPKCLGRPLTVEPPGHGVTRWAGSVQALLPLECDCCGNRGKISLLKRRRWKDEPPPAPPVYRGDPRRAFGEGRSLRLNQLQREACEGIQGWPPEGSSRRPELTPLLAEALADELPELRREAITTLALMNHEATLPVLIQALRNEDVTVRVKACMGLGWLGRAAALKSAVVPVLREACDQPGDWRLRFDAAIELARLGELHTADPIVEGLKGYRSSTDVIAEVLVRFDRKDAILLIIKQMAVFPDEHLKHYGAALEGLTGEHLGDDPVAWYRWFDRNRARFPKQRE